MGCKRCKIFRKQYCYCKGESRVNIEQFEYLNPNIIHFVERKNTPDWIIPKRQNGFHELYFILDGKAAFNVDGQCFTAQAGDIVYIKGGSTREAHTYKACPVHTFAVNFHWLNDNHVSLPFGALLKNKMNQDILAYLTEIQQVHSLKPTFSKFKERALFMLLLNHLFQLYFCRVQSNIDPRIKKILDYIHLHFADQIEINRLAHMINLHAVYLGKLFKENTGFTVKAYLNRIRINQAERLLAAGQFSVTEVAEQCGFSDIYYFSKVFKRTKGYSPSIVIKQNII